MKIKKTYIFIFFEKKLYFKVYENFGNLIFYANKYNYFQKILYFPRHKHSRFFLKTYIFLVEKILYSKIENKKT